MNISESVIVPFGPPKVMTAAERQRSFVMRRRLRVTSWRVMRSMAATQANRMPTTTAATMRIVASRVRLLICWSFQLASIASGSSMPSKMNTAPFNANESTDHTLDATMFVRATFGPTPERSKRMIRPAATTERMPETWIASAPKYSRNGRNSSINTRVVVVSQPSERTVSNSQLMIRPSTMPTIAPPKNEMKNSPIASPTSNVPVTAAAMANWNPTMPEASLNNDSPLSTPTWRCESDASWLSELTATASVGPRAAPSASAAASGTTGHAACSVNPTPTIVAMASPTARESESFNDLSSEPLSISCASRYSSGAMNSTMNNSGSSSVSGKNGSCEASTPSAICTSGVETLGMNRLRNEESTTAAMMHRINSNVGTTILLARQPLRNPEYQAKGHYAEAMSA